MTHNITFGALHIAHHTTHIAHRITCIALRVSHISCILAFVLIGFAYTASSQTVTSKLSADSVMIGDHLNFTVNVSLPQGMQVSFLQFESEMVPGIEVISFSADTTKSDNQEMLIEAKYLIIPFDSGQIAIPPFPVLITRGGQADTVYSQSACVLKVGAPTIAANFEPYDIKAIKTYPFEWVLLILCVLLGLVLLGYVYWFIFKRQTKFDLITSGPIRSPYELAVSQLQQLKSSKMIEQGKTKEYYSSLSDIVRIYIEHRSNIQAMEKTSDEILSLLPEAGFTQSEQQMVLRELFTYTDLVKFAKYIPSESDNQMSWEYAYRFIEKSKPVETVPEIIAETDVEAKHIEPSSSEDQQ